MSKKYPEAKDVDFARLAADVQKFWEDNRIFEKSIETREGKRSFTFYEGPPSANGTPGIHHVMARTVKDIFCRYKTLQGFQVKRKGGWDTHGLPVELQVEKNLGITKDDIGKTISIEAYNQKCRETVMMYKDQWDDLTRKMGYWVDLDDPYITYEKEYIETLWWLLKQLYQKNLLYKGYTIQPYSPAAGTGLSSHELNLPGCYRDVKDTSVVAQFVVKRDKKSEFLFSNSGHGTLCLLAWTTTPWTLPSNTALAVGEHIEYVQVDTFNTYTFKPVSVVLAKELVHKYFTEKQKEAAFDAYKPGDKVIPYRIVQTFTGKDLLGIRYEQLLPYATPLDRQENAFQVVAGDFVTTEDGTGIVHISPTFGADDFRVANQNGIPPLTVRDEAGNEVPTVDKKGKFVSAIGTQIAADVKKYGIKTHKSLGADDFYVKNYTNEDENHPDYKSTDVILSIILKEENKAFRVEKYEHSYPHCWRTDKPVLYYPLDSWFIRTTALKERMSELNKTINWKPASTGSGRFGNWLDNLVDWNLSRSRFFGTPLPIWRTEDGKEEKCIGSLEELKQEIEKAARVDSKFKIQDSKLTDLHRPYVDNIVLISDSGKPMYREPDLIDVWFDSGAMPYAQWHYPFEQKERIDSGEVFPADFIAEGVDQTRGWFFTLHAIAVMLFDSVAFRNVISNGLVLDKNGNKMSKSKGNVVNPFTTIEQYGPDIVRWYMIENAPPWDNLKFDFEGLKEVHRKFFGTLLNTYSFFALYANIDGYEKQSSFGDTLDPTGTNFTALDRWILSKLQTLIKTVREAYDDYEPTKAARAIQDFVIDHLSNWYVRLNRKRFWQPSSRGELSGEKKAAYDTLYQNLLVISQLASPIAPFFSEWLYKNLSGWSSTNTPESIHLTDLVQPDEKLLNTELEQAMDYAQRICSLVHSIRKESKIKVRTPLQKILLPVLDSNYASQVKSVQVIILSEVNVKAIEYIDDASGLLVKRVKPNFPKLGKQYGPKMKEVAAIISEFSQDEINQLEKNGSLSKNGYSFTPEDVLISFEDIPGWSVASDGNVTVALDITLTDDLKEEGIARDLVNRIQNMRKDNGLDVLDKIRIEVEESSEPVNKALRNFDDYIRTETQALSLKILPKLSDGVPVELDEHALTLKIEVDK